MRNVTVSQGVISPEVTEDSKVSAYKGIPYAAPPVGLQRWRAPLRAAPWDGVRPATSFGASAPQPMLVGQSLFAGGQENMSEDCLFLNVWTSASDRGDRLPVVVWLHLGAFQFGSGSVPIYDGTELARSGAVVVTLNYRLGYLGFLAHSALTTESGYAASGNYGLLDQIAALKWVQENIAAFGGDPGNVTIGGLSAGGASVSLLMISPLARGLFAKAVAMSGGLLGPVGRSSEMADAMQSLPHAEAEGAELVRRTRAGSISDLREMPLSRLYEATATAEGFEWRFDALGTMKKGAFDGAYPIVDGYVVPDVPYRMFEQHKAAKVPLMTGSSADEKAGMPYLATMSEFLDFARDEYGDMVGEFSQLFPAASDSAAVEQSARSAADRVFIWQNYTMARLHGSTPQPTYYYHTSHPAPLPDAPLPTERNPGAFHSIEILYMFRNLKARSWPWTDYDLHLSTTMSTYLLNFARSGNPNGSGLPHWPQFGESAPHCMHFGETIATDDVPRIRHLEFWDRFFESRRS